MSAWWSPLRETASQWLEHKDARLGAALAYYSIFSLGPLIVIAIAIAGLVFGLGLAITRKLVRMMGGDVTVAPEPAQAQLDCRCPV